jgi:hypothetical protein
MSKEKMVYAVVIFRTDSQHIQIMESADYDKCYEKWKFLHTEWTASTKEQRPFILEDPIVTAFTPSVVYEIKLLPIMSEEMSVKSNNPYQQKMNQSGFSNMFAQSGTDLLSGR